MKKLGAIQFVIILVCASLLAGCGSTAPSKTTSDATAVDSSTAAAPATSKPAATAAPVAVLATATVKAPAAKAVDACALITKDDVDKVLGQAFVAASADGSGGNCAYTFQLARFDLTITNTGGTQFMKTTRTRLADSALDIPGLGDEALYNVNSSAMMVRKGEAVYMLTYLDSMVTQNDKIAKEKTLAEIVLSRLN